MVATTSTGDDLHVRHTFTTMMNESGASFLARLSESLSASYCNGKNGSSLGRTIPTSAKDVLPCAADVWSAMAQDERIVRALTQLANIEPTNKTSHFYVADVCNAMSLVYVENMLLYTPEDMPVAFFDATYNSRTHGDFLREHSKSDWVAFLVPLRMLRLAVAAAYNARDPTQPVRRIASIPNSCSQVIAAGACSPDDSEFSDSDTDELKMDHRHFMQDLVGYKRYRPDLKTMHGFFLRPDDSEVWFAYVDAFCRTYHSEAAYDDEDAWISFVVLVYDAVANRDMNIALLDPDGPHVRYIVVSPAKGETCCVPFFSSTRPGRMTWAAFEVASDEDRVCQKECQGFIKVSWQDIESAGKERKLFNKAHKGTWLPGLARNWDVSEDEENINDRESISAEGMTRVKDVTHLGSVGDPLSQCTSALHAFMLFFDLVGVHSEMVRRGVIHRDISWFNILCNPWHHPGTTKIKQPAKASEAGRCLEYVLTGDEDAQPCVLLTDLDHSADMLELYEETYVHRKQRTGTPMFIALELGAGDTPIPYEGTRDPSILLDALRDAEIFGSYYQRMFPVNNPNHGRFMKDLEGILELERIRRKNDTEAYTNPDGFHLPMHDVESMFWSFIWLFIRALPKGFEPERNSQRFIDYVKNVLHATMKDEHVRVDRLFKQNYKPLTHEKLHIWLSALENMAIYFSIPWGLYQHKVSLEHAHIAVRRLLFSAMLRRAGQNVRFNCSQPRSAWEASNSSDRQSMPPTRDSQLPPAVSRASASKRKTLDDGERIASSSKRLKLDSSAAAQPSTPASTPASKPAPKPAENPAENPAETPGQQLAKKPAQKGTRHCCSKDGCNARSVGARCEKMWNDRFLWFGVGKTKPNNKVKKSNDNGGIEVVGDVVDEDVPLETSHIDNIENLLVAARAQFKLTEQKRSMATGFVHWNPKMAL